MYNYQCPHLDYGKSADKALGAYCLLKKTCVEDCEGCNQSKLRSGKAIKSNCEEGEEE